MGSTLSRYHPNQYDLNNSSLSLKNQRFKVRDQTYTFLKRLGGGAFGSVWSAVSSDGHSAAVKAIDVSGRTTGSSFDPAVLIESFHKEVTMAYKMRQETRHVVTIYGFDFDARSGLALMAMELGGESLADRIEMLHVVHNTKRAHTRMDGTTAISGDYISSRERKNIWMQLNNIVQTLHRHHVVHRDMKPDNLVFFGPIMKIVDLGIAQKEVVGHDPNADGIGTPFYSAPECLRRGARITSKADIWSAGAILYHMTYGPPLLHNAAHTLPVLYPTHSANVDEILHRCLQRDVHQRGSHTWLAHHPYTKNPRAF